MRLAFPWGSIKIQVIVRPSESLIWIHYDTEQAMSGTSGFEEFLPVNFMHIGLTARISRRKAIVSTFINCCSIHLRSQLPV